MSLILTRIKRESILRRLLRHINVLPSSKKCWEWNGATITSQSGTYGYIWIDNKKWSVRRLSYILHKCRPYLKGNTVTCTCGNSLCINPKHLVRSDRAKSDGPTTNGVK